MRRRAIRTATIVAMALLLAPTLAMSAPGQRWSGGGARGHGSHGWGGTRWSHGSAHGRHWRGSGWGGFAVGIGIGTLLTAPWWIYPRVYAVPAYPAYPVYPPYPAYPVYPRYAPYPAPYPVPPPPSDGSQEAPPAPQGFPAPGSLAPTPELSSSGPQASQDPSGGGVPGSGAASAPLPPAGCETVTAAGHWEMRVYSDGQRLTVWVPTSTRSVCR